MQSIAETCVRFDAAHLSINLVSEIAVPMFTTLKHLRIRLYVWLEGTLPIQISCHSIIVHAHVLMCILYDMSHEL